MWVILLSCLLKVGVQLEFGRHCICHGKTTFEAWNSAKGFRIAGLHWTVFMGLFYLLQNLFGQGGVLGGATQVLHEVVPAIPSIAWVFILATVLALLVFHGRYGPIEFICVALNIFFVLAVFICVVGVQWTEYAYTAGDIAGGLAFNLPEGALVLAIAAFGITGVAAGEIFVYPSWCVEKGYAAWTGPHDDSPEWAHRARGWTRVMTIDALVSMVVYTTSTIGFYILGAAILHPQGDLPENSEMVGRLSTMFTEVVGSAGLVIFMLCAFFVFFSTVFSNLASNSRLWSDFLSECKFYDKESTGHHRRAIAIFAWLLPFTWAGLYIAFDENPVFLVTLMGIANTLLLIVVAYQAIIYRFQQTDPRVAPSKLYDAFFLTSVIAIGAVAIIAITKLF
jgi:hypothetical protein